MAKVYFDDEQRGILKANLFDDEARKDANKLLGASAPPTQLRRYFGEIRALQARFASLKARDPENAFAQVRPYLGLLKAKAYYGRRNDNRGSKAMHTLSEVLTDCIDGVKNEKTFDAMVQYVEAVVAYFTPDSRNSRR